MRLLPALRSFTADVPHLIFFVTGRCNAKCSFCFYWQNLNRNRDELTLAEVEAIAARAGRVPHLSLSGGEPFLRRDLPELIAAFHARAGTRFVTIPTNGLQPARTREIVERTLAACADLNLSIVLSLDALGHDHDALRGVAGTFAKLRETHDLLVALRASEPRLRVLANTVVSAFNQDQVAATLDFVRDELRVDRHSLAVARGDTKDPMAREVDAAKLARIYARRTPTDGSLFADALEARARVVRGLTLEALRTARQPLPCTAGRSLLVMSETGELHACEILDRPLGNLRDFEYDIRRVMATPAAREVLRSIRAGECACTWECALNDSVLASPRAWPAVARELVALRRAHGAVATSEEPPSR